MKRLEDVMRESGAATLRASTPTISNTSDSPEEVQHEGVCPLCGGLGYLREDVPVDHPHFGQLFPCRCKAAELEHQRRERLRVLSNLDHVAHMTFESFLPEGYGLPPGEAASLRLAFELAQQFAEDPRRWLVLLGGYGCGKTHLAAAIANRLLEWGHTVLFIAVPDLLDHLRATFGPDSPVTYDERFEEIRNVPILILDDLGTQSSTPWAQEKLFQILNHRYLARLPTVVTSNQSMDDLDARIRSRMEDPGLVTPIEITAPDFRRGETYHDGSGLSSLGMMKEMDLEHFDLREAELPAEERENLKRAFTVCQAFAEDPEGWLLLTGVYGCGKTHLAAAIANKQTQLGRKALFVVVPDLLDHLRATFSPSSQVRFDRRFEEVKTAPFLVIDDLGTESASPWAQEKLFQLVNHRYAARLPTVITTAKEVGELEPRLRSRVLDVGLCTVFGIIAPSYRGSPKRRARRGFEARSRRSGR